jgi:hypothetical protein
MGKFLRVGLVALLGLFVYMAFGISLVSSFYWASQKPSLIQVSIIALINYALVPGYTLWATRYISLPEAFSKTVKTSVKIYLVIMSVWAVMILRHV